MIGPEVVSALGATRTKSDTSAPLDESQVRERLAALDAAPDGVAVFDEDLTLRYANPAFCKLCACSDFDELADLLAGAEEGWARLFDPGVAHTVKDEVLPLVMRSGSWRGRLPARRCDGAEFTADLSLARTSKGGFVVMMRDVTKAAAAETELRERQEMYCLLATNSTDVISLHEIDGEVSYISPSSLRLMGCEADALVGRTPWSSIHPEDRERARAAFARAFEGGTGSVSYRLKVKSGVWVWFETLVRPVRLDDGADIVRVQCSTRDVTAQKELEQQLEHQALHDPLTGLPNRSLFMDRLSQAPLRARRSGKGYGIAYLDLNRFKQVNDEHGHAAGDELLVQVAERLTERMRESDTLARLSGDEFAVILENLEDANAADQLGLRLLTLFDEPFLVDGTVVNVRPSIGVAVDESGDAAPDELLRSADLAMYAAKRDPDREFVRRLGAGNGRGRTLQQALRRAMERDELKLHYQPLVASADGRPVALEALLRWRHGGAGFVPPPEILAIAQQGEFGEELTRWIVRAALRDSRAWRLNGFRDLRLCLNLTEEELGNPDLVSIIDAALAESDATPSLLQLELRSESLRRHTDRIGALRTVGAAIAVDGFGADPVSLPQLARAPVDSLKISRSLVALPDVGEGGEGTGTVEAIVGIGHRLGFGVTAEGVETSAQAERFRDIGCDTIQGFYVGRPLPTARVGEYLARLGPRAT